MPENKCFNCGEAVSPTAEVCISCGYFLDVEDHDSKDLKPGAVAAEVEDGEGENGASLRNRVKKDPFWLLMLAIPLGIGGLCAISAVVGILSMLLEAQEPLRPDCTMNGHGSGDCVFTNTTKRAAGGCGRIRATCDTSSRTLSSATFCSGDVEPGESRTRRFSVAGFDRITPNFGDWRDFCGFIWIPAE